MALKCSALLSLAKILHIISVTSKRCKIEGQLLLMSNRKSYMGFRLVLKSVTLYDLERCNGHYFALFRGIR